MAQHSEDVEKVNIPSVSPLVEQLSVKAYRERKQDMAQYGS